MTFQPVRFQSQGNEAEFQQTLKQRVSQFFDSQGISKHANAAMVTKTVALLLIYFIPYVLIVTGAFTGFWAMYGLWLMMGIGMAGVGFSVMHDANHGAYSSNPNVNKWLGNLIYLLGGNPHNWRIQHNVLHHSFTNIAGMDEDLDSPWFLRFSPDKPYHKIHRFQYLYAWFLYGLMTLMWSTTKDFRQALRYKEKNLLKTQRTDYKKMVINLIFTKFIYYVFVLGIPLVFSPFAWWQLIIGYISMHLITGFILAIVFQPAHVVPEAEFPHANDQRVVEQNWAVHELLTTANFAPNNKILSWYIGGLNFQIEHHLFPNICHIHYPKLSAIVRQTAEEFGFPYHSMPNFRTAIREHARLLRELGQPQTAVAA